MSNVVFIGYSISILLLLIGSSFFSASEAALFSMTWKDRRTLKATRRSDATIERLLADSNRLLSAILFCNLVLNMGYFTLVSAISARLAIEGNSPYWAGMVSVIAVLILIVFGELIPKSAGVTSPMMVSRVVAQPLYLAVRIVNPITPALEWICEGLRRLIWPSLKREEQLETIDLERAVELSGGDSALIEHEKRMLQNVIQLSVLRAAEWMRPRSEFEVVSRRQLQKMLGQLSLAETDLRGRYLLVTNEGNEELIGYLRLDDLNQNHTVDLTKLIHPWIVTAWCESLARVYQQMLKTGRKAALVVNELGDSIGVITQDDLISAVFCVDDDEPQGFSQPAFTQTGELQWEVTGSTSLRRIERALGQKLANGRDVTMAGLVQNKLRRLPRLGDQVRWGNFVVEVLDVPRRGEILMKMSVESSELDQMEIEDDS